ncbi:MAG TPA: (Fe-S)-binding protein [Polyangiaceae bacterium]|nr:(Fe-S)-binding protein [Polyangiaceae bacterium]
MTSPRRLRMLDDRRAALETCGYCPKLCRAACPVSEVEASEALIPWGKMTLTWYAARGDLTPDRDLARLPWACTACFGCRERCEHQNPVAQTLVAARAVYREDGLAPAASEAAHRRITAARERLATRARELATGDARADTALVVGCGYLGSRGREANDVVRAARALFGAVRVLDGCCGVALEEAGDAAGARELRDALVAEADGRRLVVADAGCAAALRGAGAETLVEAAAQRAERLERIASSFGPFRWHDPCRLARGLGVTREPRLVLERALGAPPAEFERAGADTRCSGAGALLPFVMPRTARLIARDRLAEHEKLGGGTIVTACATSLGWFRAQGARAIDLSTIIARSLTSG